MNVVNIHYISNVIQSYITEHLLDLAGFM